MPSIVTHTRFWRSDINSAMPLTIMRAMFLCSNKEMNLNLVQPTFITSAHDDVNRTTTVTCMFLHQSRKIVTTARRCRKLPYRSRCSKAFDPRCHLWQLKLCTPWRPWSPCKILSFCTCQPCARFESSKLMCGNSIATCPRTQGRLFV